MSSKSKKSTLSGSSSSRVTDGSDSLNPRISEDEYNNAMGFDYDQEVEDTFPASDPPSTSPMTGVGRNKEETRDPSGLPKDFKDNKAAQFEYGRRSEASTLHFDRSTNRLRQGNPDVGEVDLGTITADRPAQPDDDDHFDTPDEKKDPANEV